MRDHERAGKIFDPSKTGINKLAGYYYLSKSLLS